ncbi:hypothetical protein CapIbe_004803 [Capra ibex]
MPAQAVPVNPRRPAPCATPEKRINSSPPLLLPSGFPGYRGSNPDGFLCVVPPPARRQGERDRRVVTSTASRPAARLRAERLGDVLQAMGHGCGTHLGAVHLETRRLAQAWSYVVRLVNSDLVHFKPCERDLCSGGTCKHGDFEIRLRNSEPKVILYHCATWEAELPNK